MELKTLKKILKKAWAIDTCVATERREWTKDNPALGQCDITALIVNDYFGGEIMRVTTDSGSHYYNQIDGKTIDLTVEQFNGEIPEYEKGKVRTREYLLSNEDTRSRYVTLFNNIERVIDNDSVLRAVRYLEKQKETMHKMTNDYEYIDWLTSFAAKHPHFDDYPDSVYMLKEMTRDDLRNVNNISLLFKVIDEYVAAHNKEIYSVDGRNYYLFKYRNNHFEIGFIPGQGCLFYVSKHLPLNEAIDFEYIMQYHQNKDKETKKKIRSKDVKGNFTDFPIGFCHQENDEIQTDKTGQSPPDFAQSEKGKAPRDLEEKL